MRRVTLATDVELAVEEFGEGEPVLLLHAWGETHRSFDRLIPLLPDSWRVVVPDQRGVGESAKPEAGYSLQDSADDMIALLDALGIGSCWMVGTSSGGYVAQQVAVSHPERVRGLVLIGAPGNLQHPLPKALVDILAGFEEPVTEEDVQALNGELPLHTPVPDDFLDDQVAAALTIPRNVWASVIDGLVAAEPPVEQGEIVVPTLILWGAEDDVLPAGHADELAAAIPGSRRIRYDGTGHLVLWEQPERVAVDLVDFVTRSRDTAFTGSIPDLYEQLMVPMIFAQPAARTAETVDAWRERSGAVDVLETAAGTGVVTRALDALGGLRIVATDLNDTMLRTARARGTVGDVGWQVADLQSLPFEGRSFDVVVCQFGVMFLPDKAVAYSEALRVLRPGGLFVFAVWDRIEANELALAVTDILTTAAPGDDLDFLRRTPHGYFDADEIERTLDGVGFAHIDVQRRSARSRTTAADAAVALCQGTPLRGRLDSSVLGAEQATALVEAGLRERYGDDAVDTPISWLEVSAHRPR